MLCNSKVLFHNVIDGAKVKFSVACLKIGFCMHKGCGRGYCAFVTKACKNTFLEKRVKTTMTFTEIAILKGRLRLPLSWCSPYLHSFYT